MATRVQVILEEEERERFRRIAKRSGLSLSAWMKLAARQKEDAERRRSSALSSRSELDAFFAACDVREAGREPDWSEHLAVIERSRGSALP